VFAGGGVRELLSLWVLTREAALLERAKGKEECFLDEPSLASELRSHALDRETRRVWLSEDVTVRVPAHRREREQQHQEQQKGEGEGEEEEKKEKREDSLVASGAVAGEDRLLLEARGSSVSAELCEVRVVCEGGVLLLVEEVPVDGEGCVVLAKAGIEMVRVRVKREGMERVVQVEHERDDEQQYNLLECELQQQEDVRVGEWLELVVVVSIVAPTAVITTEGGQDWIVVVRITNRIDLLLF
jgi:hypothetical protein